jgi:hypothetical protein
MVRALRFVALLRIATVPQAAVAERLRQRNIFDALTWAVSPLQMLLIALRGDVSGSG